LIVYYAMVLRARNVAPPAQALRLRELLKERRGRDARELCAQQPTALAAVAAAGLDFLKENPKVKSGMLKEIMESEGARQAGRMQNMIHYLLDLSAVAPMVGLLGTVIGMLKAFNSVAFDLAKARPMELAAGWGRRSSPRLPA
jgi:biopolymer transport protein ExbB